VRILTAVHLVTVLIYFCLMIYVFFKRPKSNLNRVCALVLFTLLIWNFGAMFMRIAATKNLAMFWLNISSIGWIGFSSVFLWQTLIIVKKEKILKKKITLLGLIIIPLVLIYRQYTGYLANDFIKTGFGWSQIWSDTVWPALFLTYYVTLLVLSLILLLKFRRETEYVYRKKQSLIISSTLFISFLLATLTDVVFPEIGLTSIPAMGSVTSLVWGGGLVYSITRYGFLSITPASAAVDIISSMGEALFLINREGKILLVNRAAEKLLGYTGGELKEKEANILFPEEKPSLTERIFEEKSVKIDRFSLVKKDGSSVPVAFTASVAKNREGIEAGIVIVAHDMRDSIRKSRELEESYRIQARMREDLVKEEARRRNAQMKRKLNRTEKLATIGRLSGSLGHEIRTPLSSIKNTAYYLEKYVDLKDTEARAYIDILKSEVKRVEDILTSMLDFSKTGEMKISRVGIEEAVDEVIDKMKIDPNIKIRKRISQEASGIKANEFKFKRLLENLIRNAVEATQKGGEIEIKTEKTSSGICLFVKDSGEGMEKEELKNIFEPLYTTKEKRVGLGTAIIKEIVDSHGWKIEVRSEKGEGSEFKVCF